MSKKEFTNMPIVYKGMGKKKKVKGKGLIKDVYKKVREYFLPHDLSSKFKAKMKQYGNNNIVDITVARSPVQRIVQKLLNFITVGKYDEMRKRLGYDDVYHLYLILTLDNGKRLRLEKNQIIQMTDYSSDKPDKSTMPVSMGKPIKLNDFIDKGIKHMGIKNFVRYSANELNCQNFVNQLLTANGINTPELRKFINQDIEQLLTPLAKDIGQVVTDVAGTVTQLTGGKDRSLVFPSKFSTMPVIKPAKEMIGYGVVRF